MLEIVLYETANSRRLWHGKEIVEVSAGAPVNSWSNDRVEKKYLSLAVEETFPKAFSSLLGKIGTDLADYKPPVVEKLSAAGAADFISDVDRVPRSAKEVKKNAFAVVIGIENYRDLQAAEFTTRDARTMKEAERKWLPESFVDPNGRLFEWHGGLYRMLSPGYGALWGNLFKQGFAKELIRDGLLVESEITDAETETGALVVKHRRVPVTSYCFEWSPLMLREAACVTLDLCIRLAERGLTLQDGHPWNILFDGPRPVSIDLSSIVPARDDLLWAPYQQFCRFFIYPLYLYSAGRDRLGVC